MHPPDVAQLAGDPNHARTYLRDHLRQHGVDPDTRFMFFSQAGKRPPGCGAQEEIPRERRDDFAALAAIPDWRRKLSNFYRSPITLEIPSVAARDWMSVEHYFQAYKLSLADPDAAARLSISGGALGAGDDHTAGLEARKQRKAVLLNTPLLAHWDTIKWAVMESALREKFSADPFAEILACTLDAHLTHIPGRARRHGSLDRDGRLVDHSQWGLMRVRAQLADERVA